MKIVLITLVIIGLLKLVSLFILCIIELYSHITDANINGMKKSYGIYKDDQFYLIPTISFAKSNQYFEIMVYFLWFQLYSSYYIDKDRDEPSSV